MPVRALASRNSPGRSLSPSYRGGVRGPEKRGASPEAAQPGRREAGFEGDGLSAASVFMSFPYIVPEGAWGKTEVLGNGNQERRRKGRPSVEQLLGSTGQVWGQGYRAGKGQVCPLGRTGLSMHASCPRGACVYAMLLQLTGVAWSVSGARESGWPVGSASGLTVACCPL